MSDDEKAFSSEHEDFNPFSARCFGVHSNQYTLLPTQAPQLRRNTGQKLMLLMQLKRKSKGVKEPPLVVYKDEELIFVVNLSSCNENNSFSDPGHTANSVNVLEVNGTNHEANKDYHQNQPEKLSVSREKLHL